MRADGVSVKTMKTLVVDAARKQGAQLGNRKRKHAAKSLPAKGHPVAHPQRRRLMRKSAFDGRIFTGMTLTQWVHRGRCEQN